MDAFFEQAERELNLCYLEGMDALLRENDLSCIAYLESGNVNQKKKQ